MRIRILAYTLICWSVVFISTGDLTHAKFADGIYSQQIKEEWKAYRDILRETGVTERQPWLDIRGNHGQD